MLAPKPKFSLEDTMSDEIAAVVGKAFSTMFGISPKVSAARVHASCAVRADVSGVVPLHELREKQVQGTLVLSFPEATLYSLLEIYYQRPFDTLNGTAKASVGELTNILYSMIKKNLNETGTALRSAIPSVIVGPHQHEEHCSFDCTTVVIDFSTNKGQFTVYANVERE